MSKQTWMVFLGILGWMASAEQTHAEIKFREHERRADAKQPPPKREEEEIESGFNLITWAMPQSSEGRRVSLAGKPMPGKSPEIQTDSDYYQEDTYLDSFSLDVQHSVTDMHIPVGSGHLALEVRRTLTQEVWGQHGFGPDERPDKPFGRCWLSNISPSIHWYTDWVGGGYYYVTDHTGQQYTFATFSSNYENPFPVGSSGQDAMDMLKTTLVKDSVANTFTLTLPSGTKLYYAALPDPNITDNIARSYGGRQVVRPAGSGSVLRYHLFARLLRVEDRHGSSLVYSGGMIPSSITAQPSGLSLSISSSGGRVTSITDPKGNTITYHYDGSVEGMDDDDLGATIRMDGESMDYLYGYEYGWPSGTALSQVERETGAATTYQYWYLAEEDYRQYSEGEGGPYPNGMYAYSSSFSPEDQYHLNIRSITDANSKKYSFTFTSCSDFNFATWSFVNPVYVNMLGAPRLLYNVTVPDDRGSITMFRNSMGTLSLGSGQYGIQTHRTTTVYDLDGTHWQYAFLPDADPLQPGVTNWFEWRQPDNRSTRCYAARKLEISNNKGFKESIHFAAIGIVDSDIPEHADADPTVVAVRLQKDQWGNETRYEYGQMPTSGYVQSTSIPKTTKRYDAYNQDARYSYYSAANQAYQPDWEYDELDRQTDYTYLTSAGKFGLLSQKTVAGTQWKTRYLYTNTTWKAFMTTKIEDQATGDPSFVQRTILYVPHARGMVAQETVDPGGLNLTTRYDYDSNNNRIMEVDPNSNTNRFAYDALNRLVAVTNADLTVRSFAYDPRGNKVAETNENGHVTFWQYDGFNRVTNEVVDLNGNGVVDAADLSTKTTYNAMGSVSSVTDPNGTVTTNLYDALQRLTNSIVDPGGLHYSTTYAYSTNSGSLLFEPYGFKPTRIVDARGYETKITYDKLYREVKRETQVNATEYAKATKGYDAVGNLRFSTNWVNATQYQVVEHTYDALNQPLKTIYCSATPVVEVETDYTSTGLLWRQWDELDRLTTTEYDKAQRPWKTTQPAVDGVPPVTITQYDSSGNATNVINPRQVATAYRYDKRNRKTHSILPQVHDAESGNTLHPTITTFYDNLGNVAGILDARQNLTTNFYDAANRLTNSIRPVVAVYGGTAQPYTKTTYDKNGNPRFVEDANGVVVEMRYDALNRLLKSIDGELHSIAYNYDAAGNRTSITDPNGNATVFEYDGLNRNTRTTYADGSAEQTGFDWLGNRIYREDAKAQRTDYLYDKRNRLDLVTYQGGRTRDYVYDNAGNLLDVYESGNALADVHYTYDALNRVKTETSAGVSQTNKYDLAGNRTNATYGVSGRKVGWAYDNLNRIQTITDTKGYTATINVSGGGSALQTAINGAANGSLILVANGTYSPITINKPLTVKSVNGASSASIAGGSPATRRVTLSNNAVLVGFTLSGGNLADGKGAGALVGNGCLIADCLVSNNVATGVNAYGGGLFLQTGATAQNSLVRNNRALNGGGIFCEKGGLVRNCSIENNEAESMGGGGIFMQEGGWIANSIIDGNIATNGFARGGGGLFFYNEGGKVNSSTISYNASLQNGGIGAHHSTYVDPLKIGRIDYSILWNNAPGQGVLWNGTGNQTVDPSTVSSAPGANLSIPSFASVASSRSTQFKYDLNGNLMLRDLPNGVDENRSYDALNRMVAQTNQLQSTVFSTVEYQYDAVGNLRQMDDSVAGLHTIPSSATWSWMYDDSYRLKSETVTAGAEPSRKTEFDWDAAGNRTERRKYESTVLKETVTYKPSSRLNQMLGWICGATNALYTYDANGNRQDKFIIVNGTTDATNYEYDEDNRLTKVTVRDTEQPKVYSFVYDYRTRRIARETPTDKTTHVFDGGLSVQEFDVSTSATLSANNLATESIRGEGMGGGVGGMVYSVRNGQLEASHTNHRGDVTAHTGNSGNLTWFARYAAYGTRFHEFGNTYDRQRANTKDEESSIKILNEGERWRDLEHGVMLTPDPLGYYDGPNRYVYVQNNPITHYDSRGLYIESLWDAANVAMGAASLWSNAKAGNWKSAALDAGGLVVDVAATALPMVPAGAGAAIKAKRVAKLAGDAIDATTDTLKSADKVADGVKAAKNADKAKDAANAVENTEDAAKAANNTTDAGQSVSQTAAKKGPYSNISDHPSVGPEKNFTQTQKKKFRTENMSKNDGKLLDDDTGEELVLPKRSQKGVTPPQNEAHVDHIDPRSKGGGNESSNAKIISRERNLKKGNREE